MKSQIVPVTTPIANLNRFGWIDQSRDAVNSLSEKTNLSHFPEVRAAIRRRAGDDWDETPAPEEAHCYRPRTHFRRVHKQMLLDDIGWTPQSRGV